LIIKLKTFPHITTWFLDPRQPNLLTPTFHQHGFLIHINPTCSHQHFINVVSRSTSTQPAYTNISSLLCFVYIL